MNLDYFNQTFIFEWNTRIFCRENNVRLGNLSEKFFDQIEVKGSDLIWPMGIWAPSPTSLSISKNHDGLNHEFKKALPDLNESDIIGSPYAVYDYFPNPLVAESFEEVKSFREKLNSIGKKLILDFVPNHMAVDSILIDNYPELFLYKIDNAVVCKNSFLHKNGKIYWHGRDPYFDGWTDTVQWDFSKEETLNLHTEILLKLAEVCDGVRCDMAMLPEEEVFEKTHGKKALPYWEPLIGRIRSRHPDFIFIAEVYWNMEYQLQQKGFNYTYDKELYDRMKKRSPWEIYSHLQAGQNYKEKSLRFLENHDEERAFYTFGENSPDLFSILCFLPGAILTYEGQNDGYKIKTPVQIGRRIKEFNPEIKSFYERAFQQIISRKENKYNILKLNLEPFSDYSLSEVVSYALLSNYFDHYQEVLIYNPYSHEIFGKLRMPELKKDIVLTDIRTGTKYERRFEEINRDELFIRLAPYNSHWFRIELQP